MYLITIEPMYSQGVGDYLMVTNKIKNVEKLRKQLHKYSKNIYSMYNNNKEDTIGWEFYEYIYKITEIKLNDNDDKEYWGHLISHHIYEPGYKYIKINYAHISNKLECVNEYSNLDVDIVYDNVSGERTSHINTFNLNSKN